MSALIWFLPIAASIILLLALIYLFTKSNGLGRELDKFERRRARFLESLPITEPITLSEELPLLSVAKAKRRAVVQARTKKREGRQRRLVEHLKDLQKKESE